MAIAFTEAAILKPVGDDGHHGVVEDIVDRKSVGPTGGRSKKPEMVKSLRAQLAEAKELKDAQWKKDNNPFEPPPSLTEDEYEFFMDVEQAKKDKRTELARLEREGNKKFEKALMQARMSKVVTTVKPSISASELFSSSSSNIWTENHSETSTTTNKPSTVAAVAVAKPKTKKDKKKKKRKRKDKTTKSQKSKKVKTGGSEDEDITGDLLGGGYSSDSD